MKNLILKLIVILCMGAFGATQQASAQGADNCSSALQVGDGVHAVDNTAATDATPGSDQTSCAFNDNLGVWYEYVAPVSGTATASTCNDVNFDTSVSIFDACGGNELACNDDGSGCSGFSSLVNFNIVAGTSYWVRVAGYNGGTGTGNLTLSSAGIATNETCADADPITCGQTINGSTVGAAGDSEVFCGTSNGTGGGVWYNWTGTGELATFSLCGSSFDTKLRVFEGACGALTCVAGDDDDFAACGGLQSLVQFTSVSGTNYSILVHGFGGAEGNYILNLTCETAVPGCTDEDACNYNDAANIDDGLCVTVGFNSCDECIGNPTDGTGTLQDNPEIGDPCNDGIPETLNDVYVDCGVCQGIAPPSNDIIDFNIPFLSCGQTLQATTTGATPDSEYGFCGTSVTAPGVWYLVIGNGGTATASTCGAYTNYDTKISVYSTPDLVNLTCVGGNDDACPGFKSEVSWPTVFSDFYVVLVHGFGSSSGDFEINLECTEVGDIDGDEIPDNADNCPDIFNPGQEDFDGDAVLGVGGGDACDDDDDNDGVDDDIDCEPLNAAVATFPGQACNDGDVGTVNDTVNDDCVCVGTAANDECAGALPIDCGDVITGSTVGATPDGQAFCGTSNTAPGIWYEFNSTAAQVVTASTCSANTNYDSKLSVYEGSCGSLTCVGGDDDDFSCGFSGLQSIVNFSASAGGTYYILVHGFGSGTGNFGLSLTCLPPPPNDAPCDAVALALDTPTAYYNFGASADPGEVSPGGGTDASSCNSQDGWCSFETGVQTSIWFTFTAPASGAVDIGAPGWDNQIAVWTADDCNDYSTFTEVAANDDGGPGLSAALKLYCLEGTTYYVQLDGYNGQTAAGDITIADLGTDPLSVDAGGCQLKFIGYTPAEGLNHLAATATGGEPPYSYEWVGPNITTNPGVYTVTVEPTETTTYTVTVKDANNCTAESTVDVFVEDVACIQGGGNGNAGGNGNGNGNGLELNGNKVNVCHYSDDSSGNATVHCVSKNAVEAHLAHGDELGFCGSSSFCNNTNPPPPACVEVSVQILTDNFGGETSWALVELGDVPALVANGGPAFGGDPLPSATDQTVYSECLLPGCYELTVFDSFGDGICCSFGAGDYAITYDGVTTGSPSGGAFTSSESVQVGEGCAPSIINPDDSGVEILNATKLLHDGLDIQVTPNPFSDQAMITFTPSTDGNAVIDIYDLNGSLVSHLFNADVKRGQVINTEVHGEDLRSNGIYFYRIIIGDQVHTGKLMYTD